MASRSRLEFASYVATCVGIALACCDYAMLSELRRAAPPAVVLLAIAAAGALCVVLSLSIAELASRFHGAPGVRTYLREAFGDRISLTFTFGVFGVVALFASVEIHACFRALQASVGQPLGLGWECGLILLVGLVNAAGLELPARFQLVTTAVLVAIFVGLAGVALIRAGMAPATVAAGLPLQPRMPAASGIDVGTLLGATGGAIFLYTGFEWVTALGRRPSAYHRQIPLSMPLGLGILCAIFLLLTGAALVMPGDAFAGLLPHVAVGIYAGHVFGLWAMVVASVLSMLTTFNAGMMGTSRLLYALARERRFFAVGAKISLRTGAPVGAVALMTGFVLLVNGLVRHFALEPAAALACAVTYCLLYAAFSVAAVRVRRKPGVSAATFRNPVPGSVQIVLGVLFLGVGAAALLSDPMLVRPTGLIFGGLILAAAVMAGARFERGRRWRATALVNERST